MFSMIRTLVMCIFNDIYALSCFEEIIIKFKIKKGMLNEVLIVNNEVKK